jgi:adenosylcobinamide kinase / adenosylcobinamide-phosphate guanylyltransferase
MAKAPSLIFISGGVRSGKSSFAERTAVELAARSEGNLHYIATGVPFDSEMNERIKRHQQDRENTKYHWNTVEQSVNIGELAPNIKDRDILLLDCVTTLLNNELYSEVNKWDQLFLDSVYEKVITGILALKKQAGTLIVVSNEVLNEPISPNVLVFTYKKLLGHIHQRIVRESDLAFYVEAGIPIEWKKVLV